MNRNQITWLWGNGENYRATVLKFQIIQGFQDDGKTGDFSLYRKNAIFCDTKKFVSQNSESENFATFRKID